MKILTSALTSHALKTRCVATSSAGTPARALRATKTQVDRASILVGYFTKVDFAFSCHQKLLLSRISRRCYSNYYYSYYN